MFRRLYRSWLAWLLRLKRHEPVPMNAGILMIGSLLWDWEDNRPAWRDARLDIASAEDVTAPIRYGRLSGKKRGHTYTMVFSRLCAAGQAKLIRCSHFISTSQELIAEAEYLWKAEQPAAEAHRIAASWGCVALLCNPKRQIPPDMLTGWAERVDSESDYGNVSQTQAEGVLVSDDGLLHIDWPRLVAGGDADVDLILVTANDPEITPSSTTYPSAQAIADAWNGAAAKHAEYFWKNTENGIRTFQDDEIRALLRPRGQDQS